MHEDHGHHITEHKGYETTDVQVKWILFSGLVVVAITFAGYVIGTIATKYYRAQPAIGDYRATPVALEEQNKDWNLPVRLQVDPPRALDEFEVTQAAATKAFGVVSDEPEIYRIPVATAMKIVAERGLPVFPKVAAPAAAAPAEGAANQ
jgi:hypothetical protein